jgi:hypothetical protein
MEENVLNDNQRISLVEMDEISLYESINENQMLSNLALAMQSNGRTVRQLKRSQSASSTTSSEKSCRSCTIQTKTALKQVQLPTTHRRTFHEKIIL